MTRKTLFILISLFHALRLVGRHRVLLLGTLMAFAPMSPHIHLGECEFLGRSGVVVVSDQLCSAAMMIATPNPVALFLEWKENVRG